MTAEHHVVLEVVGEGRTDIGRDTEPQSPTSGVVPILVHKLCDKPERMLVKRKPLPELVGKGLRQKVKLLKRESMSDGVVFVVDSEGGVQQFEATKRSLQEGRDSVRPDFPMAIGVAQPCIESWLLADAPAIRRAMELTTTPEVPENPEELPAPQQDRRRNPKTELAKAGGTAKKELSAKEKNRIATKINDLDILRTRCPMGFVPFADEVDQQIRPLF